MSQRQALIEWIKEAKKFVQSSVDFSELRRKEKWSRSVYAAAFDFHEWLDMIQEDEQITKEEIAE